MRLRGVVLERFGPFERAEVDLCDAMGVPLDVALFVGPSGSGKSMLLRGISGILAEAAGAGEELGEETIRRTANSARCRLVFHDRVDDARVVVTLEKEIPGHGLRAMPAGSLERWREAVRGEARAATSVDGAARADDDGQDDEDDEEDRFAWIRALRDTAAWPEAKKTLEYVLRPHRLLQINEHDLVFDTGSGFAESGELGAGFESLLVMTLELLRLSLESRAEELVYVVDDIDVHLNPRAAARLLGDLRRAFPRVQLVASTHSPFVVASVEPSHVFRLDGSRSITRLSDKV